MWLEIYTPNKDQHLQVIIPPLTRFSPLLSQSLKHTIYL